MPEVFNQPRTIRFGKYILADNVIKSLIRSQVAPARTLTVSEFREHYPECSRLVRVKKPVCVNAFCFDSWTEDEQLSVSHLPEKEIPETSVLVIPSGSIVGRKGEGRNLYEQPECSALMDTVGSSLSEQSVGFP